MSFKAVEKEWADIVWSAMGDDHREHNVVKFMQNNFKKNIYINPLSLFLKLPFHKALGRINKLSKFNNKSSI